VRAASPGRRRPWPDGRGRGEPFGGFSRNRQVRTARWGWASRNWLSAATRDH
jgi:hypothetical protein